jgi:hypothetical protein
MMGIFDLAPPLVTYIEPNCNTLSQIKNNYPIIAYTQSLLYFHFARRTRAAQAALEEE